MKILHIEKNVLESVNRMPNCGRFDMSRNWEHLGNNIEDEIKPFQPKLMGYFWFFWGLIVLHFRIKFVILKRTISVTLK